MSDVRKTPNILSYRLLESLNGNEGLFDILIDTDNRKVIMDTTMDMIEIKKSLNVVGSMTINGDTVLTTENIQIEGDISVDMVDGFHVDDNAEATTDENNALYTGKKVKELLKNEISPGFIEYENPAYPEIGSIEDALNELLYVPIQITSFSNNKSVNEKGSTASNVVFNWTINTIAVETQQFQKEQIDTSLRTKTIESISQTTSYELSVTDSRGAVSTKTSTVSFLNARYFGINSSESASPELFGTLTKELVESRSKTFTVNAGPNDYIYFALPKRLGVCKFTVGGFEGGFELLPILNYTNPSGFSEDYYVYRSTNKGLGSTTVVVS